MELKCTLQGKYININHSKLNTSITIKCACLYVIFSTTASDAITCCPVIQVFRERFCPFLPKLRAKMPFLKVMRHAPLPSWEKHYMIKYTCTGFNLLPHQIINGFCFSQLTRRK